ncbi:MAG: M6 family metalloprotease domain-containing protein [Candidatus Eiseniibacteriota bacterium]
MISLLRGIGRPPKRRAARFSPFSLLPFVPVCVMLCADSVFAVPPPREGGALPELVREAVLQGLARPARRPAPPRPGAPVPIATTSGRWNVPVLLVDFPDRPAVYASTQFQTLLFDTTGAVPTGSFADYYAEVSAGALTVRGQVFPWKTLPDTANFYANDSYGLARLASPQNDAGMLYDALAAHDADVNFAQYDRNADGYVDVVFMVHSGVGAEVAAGDRTQFWSITSGLANNWGFTGSYITNDPRPGVPGEFMKVDQFCILPEYSAVMAGAFTEIGVYCHEFGHALGWPDLYDASSLGGASNKGPGNWCLMSTGAFGGDSRTPSRPTHPSAWAKMDAGWITIENLIADGDRAFSPIATARRAYRLWYQGENSEEYFLLENRQRIGFDAGLPGKGLLISRVRSDVIEQRRPTNTVNGYIIPGLRIEEADGRHDLPNGVNRGDSRDPFPGTTNKSRFADDTNPSTVTLDGRPLNTSLEAIREVGSEVRAYVQLSPSGWGASRQIGDLGTSGAINPNATQPLVADALGDLWLAYTDDAATGTEVFLRRKRFGVDWGSPLPFTNEPGLSAAPALAKSAGGRLALTWWDTRDGNSEIYYAWSTPGGTFGAPRRVTNQNAFSQLPAAAWTADGGLVLAWMDGRDGGTTIYARKFQPGQEGAATDVRVSYPLPPFDVTNSGVPTIMTAGNRIVVAYQERVLGVDEIVVCVDSAGIFTEPRLLSALDGFTSNQPSLVADSDTSVWLLWRENGPTQSDIRMVRWSVLRGWDFGYSSPFRSAQSLDAPRGALDGAGNLHVLFRRTNASGLPELVESIWHRGTGVWDAGPSRVHSFGSEQPAGTGLAIDPVGRTNVVWLAITPEGRTLLEMVRAAPPTSPVAVDPPPRPAVSVTYVHPNPARGTARVVLATREARAPGTRLRLLTVAGRRLADLDAAGPPDAAITWPGTDENGRTSPPGMVLFQLLRPDGSVEARGKFVWLP